MGREIRGSRGEESAGGRVDTAAGLNTMTNKRVTNQVFIKRAILHKIDNFEILL